MELVLENFCRYFFWYDFLFQHFDIKFCLHSNFMNPFLLPTLFWAAFLLSQLFSSYFPLPWCNAFSHSFCTPFKKFTVVNINQSNCSIQFWNSHIYIFLFLLILLAPSGALIAIPTYQWYSSSTPTFSDHTGPQHWTFTFWATTAI